MLRAGGGGRRWSLPQRGDRWGLNDTGRAGEGAFGKRPLSLPGKKTLQPLPGFLDGLLHFFF
jgi:hypothetical protein